MAGHCPSWTWALAVSDSTVPITLVAQPASVALGMPAPDPEIKSLIQEALVARAELRPCIGRCGQDSHTYKAMVNMEEKTE